MAHPSRGGVGGSPGCRLRRGRPGVGGVEAQSLTIQRDGLTEAVGRLAVVQLSRFVDRDHLQGGCHHESGGTTMTDSLRRGGGHKVLWVKKCHGEVRLGKGSSWHQPLMRPFKNQGPGVPIVA